MALYDKDTGTLNVPPGMAVHLRKTGIKWPLNDLLSKLVPERTVCLFALDPRKWQGTFYSITNKDLHKIANYKPEIVPITEGTLMADMAFANAYQVSKDLEAAFAYLHSVRPYERANIEKYRFPELLIPR